MRALFALQNILSSQNKSPATCKIYLQVRGGVTYIQLSPRRGQSHHPPPPAEVIVPEQVIGHLKGHPLSSVSAGAPGPAFRTVP